MIWKSDRKFVNKHFNETNSNGLTSSFSQTLECHIISILILFSMVFLSAMHVLMFEIRLCIS